MITTELKKENAEGRGKANQIIHDVDLKYAENNKDVLDGMEFDLSIDATDSTLARFYQVLMQASGRQEKFGPHLDLTFHPTLITPLSQPLDAITTATTIIPLGFGTHGQVNENPSGVISASHI
ncbi:hypothetical protein Tco_0654438 [Tanacetum coccineum]|uniref:Uncharacterized protein n=1 Tax=Tanacetum coccineum TaxID=301880 RepID=A0ABQ4X367_9ASTR